MNRRIPGRLLAALVLCAAAGGGAALPGAAGADATAALEYQVKAAFLCNFAKFVEWPSQAFVDPGSPIVIGVLGEDPFGDALETTARGQTLNSRSMVVQRFRSVGEIKTCHLLFVSQSEQASVGEILEQLRGESILTVSDMEGFTESGGIINFVNQDKKIRFEINQQAAEQAQVKISAKLLGLALQR